MKRKRKLRPWAKILLASILVSILMYGLLLAVEIREDHIYNQQKNDLEPFKEISRLLNK